MLNLTTTPGGGRAQMATLARLSGAQLEGSDRSGNVCWMQ